MVDRERSGIEGSASVTDDSKLGGITPPPGVRSPTIATAIAEAVGDANLVLNIGAGTGNYECGRRVVALDYTVAMLRQHSGDMRVIGDAHRLPFRDATFDVALAVLTVHHWLDPLTGILEMQRVAHRQVVFTFDPDVFRTTWLADYFPFVYREPPWSELPTRVIANALNATEVRKVPVSAECADGFLVAFWKRPEEYLDSSVRRGISSFASRPADKYIDGMIRLARDLESERWHDRYWEALEHLDEYDMGCCLVIAESGLSP